MSPNITVDRISVLPQNVVDSILTRLGIKEVARTCVLSRSWRYQWHFLSKIKINRQGFYGISRAEFVKIIDHILLVHRGSVDKLELLNLFLGTHTHADRWILYVSKNGIKELDIHNCYADDKYNIPSCIFSCDLTSLQLAYCMVKPPAAFKGFGNLAKLTFSDVRIDSKVLENVINSCPLLSELNLRDIVEPPPSLKIDAPKLVMLRIQELDHFPRLIMSTPLLDSAHFSLQCYKASDNEGCNIAQLMGSMPILRKLDLGGKAFLQHLVVGDVPACLPSVCPIKHLTVSMDFGNLRDLLVAFCIFRSCPFLQHLMVWSSRYESGIPPGGFRKGEHGFWKGEHDFCFRFDHLQTVELSLFSGSESELKFVELLLSNALVLETMHIYSRFISEDAPRVVKEITGFPRISAKAVLIFPTSWNQ